MKYQCLLPLLIFSVVTWAGERYHVNNLTDVEIFGGHERDHLGENMGNAGDVNGDGFEDFVLGTADGVSLPGETLQNSAYLIYGGTDLPEQIDLLDPPDGITKFEGFGSSTAKGIGLGDTNRNGYSDILFGMSAASPEGSASLGGQALIFYGGAGLPRTVDINDPGHPAVKIVGTRGRGLLGYAVSNAGDFNGDGFMDALVVSGGITDAEPKSEALLIYGGTDVPDLLFQNQLGKHGVRFISAFDKDGMGEHCAGVGDVNGDGLDDVLVSAHLDDVPSFTYLIYGATDLPEVLSMVDLGERGVAIGPVTGERFGYRVSAAGDVDGDGLSDFMIGAPGTDPHGVNDAGAVYLIYGATDFPPRLGPGELSQYGTIIQGTQTIQRLGEFLSGPADVDGDGFSDPTFGSGIHEYNLKILLGAEGSTKKGIFRVTDLDLIEISMGVGKATYLGDTNDNGWQEIAVGSPSYPYMDRFASGRVKILYGGKFGTATPTPTLPDGPTRTPTLTPTVTETPVPVQYQGWILYGDGTVKVQPGSEEQSSEGIE